MADIDGAEAFIIAAPDTCMVTPSADLMEQVYPDVPVTRPVSGNETLLFYLQGLSMALLGVSVEALRLPSALAGVLTALTIPVRPKYNHRLFVEHMETLLDEIRKNPDADIPKPGFSVEQSIIHDSRSRALLQTLENGVHSVESPLQRLEHSMHIPVAFLIMLALRKINPRLPNVLIAAVVTTLIAWLPLSRWTREAR